ncbi:LPXTG cell wall anchor domain-containing protein [Mesobacillus maritimus]|uniref:LPXTG cell wall anchor domain-containing protein n=1 Tax=Mesobacillus maritimus TaxID=1643336 RepID=A0ABS7K4V2_9BACI|nr:LPXTG cell wall anchor domain-containing protein [Mesobacillus maritimus]MBY0097284.1 LPXTG cell wall anchor domain-containing protein [Mesobacillus maritimus]
MWKGIFAFVCLILILSTISSVTLVQAEEEYLVYDDFESSELTQSPASTGAIGDYMIEPYTNQDGVEWLNNEEENFAQIVQDPLNGGNTALMLMDKQDSDISKGGATRIVHDRFSTQAKDSAVVVEFNFMAEEIGSNSRFRLMNKGGNHAMVSLETDGDTLVYRTKDGGKATLIENLTPNTWYHVSIKADMPTMKYDVVITGGGNAEVHNLDFYQSVSDYGRFDVNTGNSSTSVYYLDNVHMFNTPTTPVAPTEVPDVTAPGEYLIQDDFEGSWPTEPTNTKTHSFGNYDITISSNKGRNWVYDPSENYAQIVQTPTLEENLALKLHDSNGSSATEGGLTRAIHQNFLPQTLDKVVVVEFDLLGEAFGSNSRVRLMNKGGSKALVSLETSRNGLEYRTADGKKELVEDLQENTWYHFKIVLDMQLQKYNLMITGGSEVELRNQPFYQNAADLGRLDLNTGHSSISTLYFDNIQMYDPAQAPTQPTEEAGETPVEPTEEEQQPAEQLEEEEPQPVDQVTEEAGENSNHPEEPIEQPDKEQSDVVVPTDKEQSHKDKNVALEQKNEETVQEQTDRETLESNERVDASEVTQSTENVENVEDIGNNELPNTATNAGNLLAMGIVLIFAGVGLFALGRKPRREF